MAALYCFTNDLGEHVMGNSLMARIVVPAKIENLSDIYHSETGILGPDEVRYVEVADALVDSGATALSMPKRIITQLGLRPARKRRVRTAVGPAEVQVQSAVRLTVQGRDCIVDVTEVPDDCPVLIGQVPLELLDFLIDPMGQRLIGNPAHGGEQMLEMY